MKHNKHVQEGQMQLLDQRQTAFMLLYVGFAPQMLNPASAPGAEWLLI